MEVADADTSDRPGSVSSGVEGVVADGAVRSEEDSEITSGDDDGADESKKEKVVDSNVDEADREEPSVCAKE